MTAGATLRSACWLRAWPREHPPERSAAPKPRGVVNLKRTCGFCPGSRSHRCWPRPLGPRGGLRGRTCLGNGRRDARLAQEVALLRRLRWPTQLSFPRPLSNDRSVRSGEPFALGSEVTRGEAISHTTKSSCPAVFPVNSSGSQPGTRGSDRASCLGLLPSAPSSEDILPLFQAFASFGLLG